MKLDKRPWGYENILTFNEVSTVKILNVKPNEELSLQKHRKRKEMWYFLTSGYVQIGNKRNKVNAGNVILIPKGTPHRLYAKNKPVKVLEVSFGKFDEKDEIRMEDKYGRK